MTTEDTRMQKVCALIALVQKAPRKVKAAAELSELHPNSVRMWLHALSDEGLVVPRRVKGEKGCYSGIEWAWNE